MDFENIQWAQHALGSNPTQDKNLCDLRPLLQSLGVLVVPLYWIELNSSQLQSLLYEWLLSHKIYKNTYLHAIIESLTQNTAEASNDKQVRAGQGIRVEHDFVVRRLVLFHCLLLHVPDDSITQERQTYHYDTYEVKLRRRAGLRWKNILLIIYHVSTVRVKIGSAKGFSDLQSPADGYFKTWRISTTHMNKY